MFRVNNLNRDENVNFRKNNRKNRNDDRNDDNDKNKFNKNAKHSMCYRCFIIDHFLSFKKTVRIKIMNAKIVIKKHKKKNCIKKIKIKLNENFQKKKKKKNQVFEISKRYIDMLNKIDIFINKFCSNYTNDF